MRYEVVPFEPWMISTLVSRARKADADEFLAVCGSTPEQVIIRGSYMGAMAGLADGVPYCVFGVNRAAMISDMGIPWMVGTVDLDRHARYFIKHCRAIVDGWMLEYRMLENHIDARNTKAIRWLKWMGFEFDDPAPYGWLGMPFLRFWRGHV